MVEHGDRMIPVRDGKLQIRVLEGDASQPLVYLHGYEGLPGWTPYLDRLAEAFRVYAPYQPGVGDSTGLEELDDLWDLVLFYDELLDALGLDRTSPAGHAYGGMVAAELAAHCSRRIDRLVLIDSLGLWLDDGPVADYFVMAPEERAQAQWDDPQSEAARESQTRPEDPAARLESDLDRTKTLSAVGKFSWPIPERGLTKRIHRIGSPTLILWGAEDGIVPRAYADEFHRLIPGSRRKVLDRCGHMPHEERPDEALFEVMGFLKDGSA